MTHEIGRSKSPVMFLVIAIMERIWRRHWAGARSAPWTEAPPSLRPPRQGKNQKPAALGGGAAGEGERNLGISESRSPAAVLAETITHTLGLVSPRSRVISDLDPNGSLGNKPGQAEDQTRCLSIPDCSSLRNSGVATRFFSEDLRAPQTYLPHTCVLPSGVRVVARGWGRAASGSRPRAQLAGS